MHSKSAHSINPPHYFRSASALDLRAAPDSCAGPGLRASPDSRAGGGALPLPDGVGVGRALGGCTGIPEVVRYILSRFNQP
jgi:hypothetical protein